MIRRLRLCLRHTHEAKISLISIGETSIPCRTLGDTFTRAESAIDVLDGWDGRENSERQSNACGTSVVLIPGMMSSMKDSLEGRDCLLEELVAADVIGEDTTKCRP